VRNDRPEWQAGKANGGGPSVRTKELTKDPKRPPAAAGVTETADLYEMANLYPDTTGLPMTVWVSPRGNARHDVRIKVNMTHGDQMNIANTAVVGLRPSPHIVAGQLSPADAQAVFQWVSLNSTALIAYWDGQIDTARLIHRLRPLPIQQSPAP
jgi:hypothetical protein